jgi:predicted nucleic acid-binding protein
VTVLVDTSVWSLVLRRDATVDVPQVLALRRMLEAGEDIVCTGLVLQELLQGFAGPRDAAQIVEYFSALPMLQPDREDHVEAARLRNTCRRAGLQIGTIDALLAQLCVRHRLTLLTTDKDFEGVAKHGDLRVWQPIAAKLPQ